jgi:hypothetical protein
LKNWQYGLQAELDNKVTESELESALEGIVVIDHQHAINDVTGLEAQLNAKAIASVVEAALLGKAPTNHQHAITEVTGLEAQLNSKAIASVVEAALLGKASTDHNHAISETSGLQAALNEKNRIDEVHDALIQNLYSITNNLAPKSHRHELEDIDELATELNVILGIANSKATTNHQHEITDVTGLEAQLNSKAIASDVTTALAAKAATVHVNELSVQLMSLNIGIVSVQANLNNKANTSEVNTALSSKAAITHQHAITDVIGLQTALNNKASLPLINQLQIALDEKVSRNNYLPIVRSIYEPDNSFPLGAIWHEMGGVDSNIANLQRTWIKNTWIKELLTLDNASGYFWISQNQYSFDLLAPNGSTSANLTNTFPLDDSYNYCFSHLLISGVYTGPATVNASDYWKMTISTQVSPATLVDTAALPSDGLSKKIPINKIFSFATGERLAFNQVKAGASSAIKIGASLRYHLIRK